MQKSRQPIQVINFELLSKIIPFYEELYWWSHIECKSKGYNLYGFVHRNKIEIENILCKRLGFDIKIQLK